MSGQLRAVATLLVVGLVAVPVGAGVAVTDATAAHGDGTSPAFVVDVAADGSAEVTVRYAFDLEDSTRADAFQQLRENETAQEAFVTAFQQRMQAVVDDTEAATDREMALGDATATFRQSGSTGVVELSVTVDGLAAVEGDSVVLSEPFASGFEPAREFRVLVPDGYEVTSVTPEPAERSEGELAWSSDASLDGFELVAADGDTGDTATDTPGETTEPPDDETTEDGTAGGGSPGFGVVAVLAALATLLAGLAAAGRRA